MCQGGLQDPGDFGLPPATPKQLGFGMPFRPKLILIKIIDFIFEITSMFLLIVIKFILNLII